MLGYTKETVMSNRAAMVGILTLTALAFVTDSALAAPLIPINAARTSCVNAGGTYFAPNRYGVYYCMNNNGHGFVCGGNTPRDKNSCDHF